MGAGGPGFGSVAPVALPQPAFPLEPFPAASPEIASPGILSEIVSAEELPSDQLPAGLIPAEPVPPKLLAVYPRLAQRLESVPLFLGEDSSHPFLGLRHSLPQGGAPFLAEGPQRIALLLGESQAFPMTPVQSLLPRRARRIGLRLGADRPRGQDRSQQPDLFHPRLPQAINVIQLYDRLTIG